MRPLTPTSNKGRTLGGDDIHHRTADLPSAAARRGVAKKMRKAARQQARAQILGEADV